MPTAEVETWLRAKRPVVIGSIELRPRAHPQLPATPLSISRGQAAALHTVAADQSVWIIKKFHSGKAPDRAYLTAVRTLLPPSPAFISGTSRRLLSPAEITGAYRPKPLVNWLDGTILMPRIKGMDWATLADALREGDLTLPIESRALLCRDLSEAVAQLEAVDCSHRDLSSGNVFIDDQSWTISLIDWDSIYHPSLTMPPNTPGGTEGYIAPFVTWIDGMVTQQSTWQGHADRFALALLCVEFLVMDEDSGMTGDGGMFDQGELRARRGATIEAARRSLAKVAPAATPLFERALAANAYDECPEPKEWRQLADSVLGVKTIPVAPVTTDWFDEDRFWVSQVDRAIAPPVVVLPEEWGTVTLTSPPSYPDPTIVLPEAWGSDHDAATYSPGARIVLPEDWGRGDSTSSHDGTVSPAIVPPEAWSSNASEPNPTNSERSKGDGT